MRGLSKATALLSSTLVGGFVIPDPALGALDVRPIDPIVENIASEATLRFVINSVEPIWGYPILTFEVGRSRSDRACGESDIKLDGQTLDSQWTGFSGVGEGSLEAYGNSRMLWTIQCISETADSLDKEGVQVFSLTLIDSKGRQTTPGFTVSYRQLADPVILHFEPYQVYVAGDDRQWQHPSLSPHPTATVVTKSKAGENSEAAVDSLHVEQQTILSHMKHVKDGLKSKADMLFGKLKSICHKQTSQVKQQKETIETHDEFNETDFALNRNETRNIVDQDADVAKKVYYTAEGGTHDELDDDSTESTSSAPTLVGQANAAATTRSTLVPSSTAVGFEPPSHNGIPSIHSLKAFFIGLSLFAFFTWLWLFHRDPRRRADRAARQEERRTKRLYRRAARKQRIKNFFSNVRVKYDLLYYRVLMWNEKGLGAEQEEFSEDVMKNDIRALRNAHRIVSSMTGTPLAAEEGHAGYHQPEASRLRSSRSVSTLPGYESESAGPPGYTSEFNSDSSVVSTSPRISLSSGGEYEEKVEFMNLGEGRTDHVRL